MKNKDLKIGTGMMIISSLMTCTGQLMWKLANGSDNRILFFLMGFALYGCGALIMIAAFGHGEVSVLQPMLSVGFAVSVILGYFVLHEEITMSKLAGIGLIIVGMFFLGKSQTKEEKP